MAKLRVALLSAAHLAMDMTTVAFVYVLIGVREFGALSEAGGAAWYSPHSAAAIAACVLAYDLLAFGLQPFVGAFVDLKKRAAPLLYASLFGAGLCAAVCVPCDFPQGIGAASAAILVFFSLCNAVFHVSAGAFVIAESEKKCAPLGVFVSLGAVGVALGRLYAPAVLFAAGACCAACAAGALFLKTNDQALAPHFERIGRAEVKENVGLAPLALLVFAVFVRGLGGAAMPSGYAADELYVLLAAICTAAGKAAGGFLADAFGTKSVALICLPVSACLMLFANGIPALYLAGLALFNTSMPVTLWLSFAAMPRMRNTAFGVMACFLMLGSVFAMSVSVPGWLAFALVLISGAAIAAAPHVSKNKPEISENMPRPRKACKEEGKDV